MVSFRESEQKEEAVFIYLDGVSLSDDVYRRYDLASLEDKLIEAVERKDLGEFDGNEIGGGTAKLFLYGPDAEKLFAAIEPVLRTYPLSLNARVVIRRGGPGAEDREVRLNGA